MPGCSDYAILAAVQAFLPELGLAARTSSSSPGIGFLVAASLLPRQLRHALDPRPGPAIATGFAATRPDLAVCVIPGDGNALSIDDKHLIHAMRRNINIKILLFNNQIYGLTKGQYSPTSCRRSGHQVDGRWARSTTRSTR